MSTARGVAFDRLCRASGLPAPLAEFQFAIATGRAWRFDWAWPRVQLALEVEGGVFARVAGRHTRGAGFRADLVKYNTATLLGWRVLRCLPEQLATAGTLDMVRRALAQPPRGGRA